MVKSFPQNQDNHARQVVSRDRVVPAFAVSGQDWPETGLRPGKVSLPRGAAGHPQGRSAVKELRSGWTRCPPWRTRRRLWSASASCGVSQLVGFSRRSPAQRRVGTRATVELDPLADHSLGFEAVREFVQVNRFVLQRAPESLDEHVVQITTATVH